MKPSWKFCKELLEELSIPVKGQYATNIILVENFNKDINFIKI